MDKKLTFLNENNLNHIVSAILGKKGTNINEIEKTINDIKSSFFNFQLKTQEIESQLLKEIGEVSLNENSENQLYENIEFESNIQNKIRYLNNNDVNFIVSSIIKNKNSNKVEISKVISETKNSVFNFQFKLQELEMLLLKESGSDFVGKIYQSIVDYNTFKVGKKSVVTEVKNSSVILDGMYEIPFTDLKIYFSKFER